MISYPDFQDCTVIVVGDIILDRYIRGDVDRISPEAPVPVIRVMEKSIHLGGAGNVALNLKGLGCQPILIGVRGEDDSGRALVEILSDENIPNHIVNVKNHPTTTKTRIIGQRQQVARLDEEMRLSISESMAEELAGTLENVLPKARALVISDYGKGLVSPLFAARVIKLSRKRNIPVFVDPKGTDWGHYRSATCITPNLAELRAASRPTVENDAAACLQMIQCLDLEYLLVTRGAGGMSLYQKESNPIHINARAREVFDVSGAGDTVIASLSAAVASGMNLRQALEFSNTAAGIVVGKMGTQPITARELKQSIWDNTLENTPKIVGKKEAREKIARWRKDGDQIVFTNGCFDILHIGHIKLLHEASKHGDRLIVGLNSDASVRNLKGPKRPVVSETERAALLSNIRGVDLVVIFDEKTPLDLIQLFEPDVLVKGGDYTPETVVGHDVVVNNGGRVIIVPLVDGVSTSNFIQSLTNDVL